MKVTQAHRDRMAKLKFADIYPLYLAKIEKKGRSKDELDTVLSWLTGFSADELAELAESDVDFERFFEKAKIHENADLITGVICGYRVEEIEDELVRKGRYMDKLVDELARGKKMESILRNR